MNLLRRQSPVATLCYLASLVSCPLLLHVATLRRCLTVVVRVLAMAWQWRGCSLTRLWCFVALLLGAIARRHVRLDTVGGHTVPHNIANALQ